MAKSARRAVLLLAVAAAFGAGAAPAGADWLVTRDGGRIETKGAFKVDGRRILFTLPNGTLSSVRADEIDLDLSAIETARALEAKSAPPPVPPKREPVLRLTEKEIPPAKENGQDAEGAKPGSPEASAGLEVISWEKTEMSSGDGVEVFGTLRNGTTNNVTAPSLLVMIYSEDGGLLATNTATINAGAIPAGRTANFRVAFPGIPDFAAAKFDAQGRGFRTQGEPGPEGEEAEGGEAEEQAPVDLENAPESGGATDELAPEEAEPSAPPPTS